MAEYKDVAPLRKQIADIKRAVNSPNSDYLTGYICALSVTEGIIAGLPVADVVPKSEVEKLKADLIVWKQERFNLYQRLELYEITRQKVAREIFEEIEQQLRGLFDFFRQDDCIIESSAIILAISEIAELKKKYTEGESE